MSPTPPVPIATAPPGVAQPLHRVAFDGLVLDGNVGITGVAVNPTGSTAYVHLHPTYVDPILVAATHWVWSVTILGVLLVALMGWRTRRVVGRPQRQGGVYCRRCNYDLSGSVGSVGEKCPECGRALAGRGRVRGRSTGRRLAPLVVPGAMLCGLGVLAVALGRGWDPQVPVWPSPTLQWMADGVGVPVARELRSTCSTVVEVDLSTGACLRTVVENRPVFWHEFGVDPTGKSLLVGASPFGSVARIDAASGRQLNYRCVGFEDSLSTAFIDRPVVGFAPDGQSAYLVVHGATRDSARVVRWSFVDGSEETVADLEPLGNGVGRPLVPSVVLLPGGAGGRVLSWMSLWDRHTAAVHTGPGLPAVKGNTDTLLSVTSNIVPSADGTRLYASTRKPNALASIDAAKFRVVETIPLPKPNFASGVAIDPSGRLVALGTQCVELRDVKAGTWRASLTPPAKFLASEVVFSADSRFVVGIALSPTATPGAYVWELVIWDIGALGGG